MVRPLILPGFVDAHAHYPQTAIIASWGKRLIDWLNSYTFPEEARLSDPAHAADVAGRHLAPLLTNGTTTGGELLHDPPRKRRGLLRRRPGARDAGAGAARPAWTATRHPAFLRDTGAIGPI